MAAKKVFTRQGIELVTLWVKALPKKVTPQPLSQQSLRLQWPGHHYKQLYFLLEPN
jgi:hypothetical protein